MTLALYRIDDRLIHGQVVVGWGQPLNASFIVLVDDEVSGSDWEQDLYRMGVPPQIEVIFASVEQAADQLPAWDADARVEGLLRCFTHPGQQRVEAPTDDVVVIIAPGVSRDMRAIRIGALD